MSLSAGESLGPYEIVEPIGSGGMGEVYRAKDVRLERSVAIKVLSGEIATNPARHERLKREAKTISKLNHPNVRALLDVGEQDGTYFRRRVSHEGGHAPQWRGDGAELFCSDGSSTIMSVAIRDVYAGNALPPPQALFTTRVDRSRGQGNYVYAVSSDGQRFLVNVARERPPSFEYTVLLDWREALSDS